MLTDPLQERLKGAPLHVLLMLLQRVLPNEGFGDPEILDRRQTRQKSRYGGFDMRCTARIGAERGTVLVKVLEKYPLRTRNIHEMAGCVLEQDALLGLIVSPGERSAKERAKQVNPKLRVRLIEGDRLANLLKCSGLGLTPAGAVDHEFFDELERHATNFLSYLKTMKP